MTEDDSRVRNDKRIQYKENNVSELLKITSPVEIKNRIQNTPRQQPVDAVFDLNDPEAISKNAAKNKKAEEDGSRQELLKNLTQEIQRPLLNPTNVQADSIRKLILYARLFEVSSGAVTENFLNDFFLLPKELLGELLRREEGATIFKGDFFDILRSLAKDGSNPKLQDAIVSLLKHFDSYVNRTASLQSILARSQGLPALLTKAESQLLQQQMQKLEGMVSTGEDYRDIIKFLKNEFIPTLRGIAVNYPPSDKVQDHLISIIHYIARYDKSNPKALEDAFRHFSEELRALYPHLTDDDIQYMKETLLRNARESRANAERSGELKEGMERPGETKGRETREGTERLGEIRGREDRSASIKEERDMAALLSKALDKSGPARLNVAAQNLLLNIIQSESPIIPLLHFMLPLRFRGEDIYGEFFIDKDCGERKGEAKEATNVFFTIQSDVYGTFEVDLLSRDLGIQLDIKCPQNLIGRVKDARAALRDAIEARGYRLTGYQVGEYTESETILRRFPRLSGRKAGIDVKI